MNLKWEVMNLVRNETSAIAHAARQPALVHNQWVESPMCAITFVK